VSFWRNLDIPWGCRGFAAFLGSLTTVESLKMAYLGFSIRCTRHLTSKIILVPPDEHRMLVGESVSVSSPEHPDKFPIDSWFGVPRSPCSRITWKLCWCYRATLPGSPEFHPWKEGTGVFGNWKMRATPEVNGQLSYSIIHHKSCASECFWRSVTDSVDLGVLPQIPYL
jgi:hypothetical protein